MESLFTDTGSKRTGKIDVKFGRRRGLFHAGPRRALRPASVPGLGGTMTWLGKRRSAHLQGSQAVPTQKLGIAIQRFHTRGQRPRKYPYKSCHDKKVPIMTFAASYHNCLPTLEVH